MVYVIYDEQQTTYGIYITTPDLKFCGFKLLCQAPGELECVHRILYDNEEDLSEKISLYCDNIHYACGLKTTGKYSFDFILRFQDFMRGYYRPFELFTFISNQLKHRRENLNLCKSKLLDIETVTNEIDMTKLKYVTKRNKVNIKCDIINLDNILQDTEEDNKDVEYVINCMINSQEELHDQLCEVIKNGPRRSSNS